MKGPSKLLLWQDRFVFSSPQFDGASCCRPSTVLIIGTDDSLELRTPEKVYSGRAFLVAPNVERALYAKSTAHYSLNLDPSHISCRKLKLKVDTDGVLNLDDRLGERALLLAHQSVKDELCCEQMLKHSDQILHEIFPEVAKSPPLDSRIDLVVSWLIENRPIRVNLSELAGLCGLSESRLAHLFTDEIGISIRQYLLWIKMRLATEMLVQSVPLSTVAHEIGFSDSSHFSRTYSRYFALKPSFLANKELVHFKICDSYAKLNPSKPV